MIFEPYTISSDQHCHDWSQFAKVGADGVNSRLTMILRELERQAAHTLAEGGTRMFLGGDLFHVRGKIDPEVLNPTIATFKRICAQGVAVYAIAGNHDLKGQTSNALGNAMQALDEIDGFTAVTEPTRFGEVMMIPWIEDLDELRRVAKANAHKDHDLIMHAPLNGVIKGIPDLGLDPDEVATWGYFRVFVGHYHNHKSYSGDMVVSIGATTHQTWSDPGTKAGFLKVYGDRFDFEETHSPQFINVDDTAIDAATVNGNYVRLRLQDVDDKTLAQVKADLAAAGALNWVDHSSKKRTAIRANSAGPGNMTIEASVANFVLKHMPNSRLDKKRVATDALAVLTEARTVGGE